MLFPRGHTFAARINISFVSDELKGKTNKKVKNIAIEKKKDNEKANLGHNNREIRLTISMLEKFYKCLSRH